MVIDDEWVVANVIELALADLGYRVITASNGRAGLERIAETRPDVILLDYMMPLLNGAGTLRKLAENPDYRNIPVILMSSLPESMVTDAKGYAVFLQKPFLDTELAEALLKVLS
ncbi:MAG TPA: response regulator [Alphaproteobacteria bacterium]|nr:response regulator [Alphaproteobacteria bacterium]